MGNALRCSSIYLYDVVVKSDTLSRTVPTIAQELARMEANLSVNGPHTERSLLCEEGRVTFYRYLLLYCSLKYKRQRLNRKYRDSLFYLPPALV